MWWVATTSGCRPRGESHGPWPLPGSSANTSRPARTAPASSASSRAASSITSPREVLSRIAPCRIWPRKPSSTRCRVSSREGTCSETMSEDDSSSCSESHMVTPSSSARATTCAGTTGLGERLDLDAERGRTLGDGEPDRAEADDAHGRPEQAVGLAVALLVPPTVAQVGDVVRDPPVDREQEPHRQLGHGGGVAAGDVGDEDPASGGGIGVDRVRAGPGADHQRQPVRGLEDRAPAPWCCAPPGRRSRRSVPGGRRRRARAPSRSRVRAPRGRPGSARGAGRRRAGASRPPGRRARPPVPTDLRSR